VRKYNHLKQNNTVEQEQMMDADPGSRSDSTLEPRHLLVLPVLGSHEDGVIDWPMRTMAVAPQSTCWYTLPVLGTLRRWSTRLAHADHGGGSHAHSRPAPE